jgi:uncharacterized protein YdiU (UPF0061 family)
MDYGPFAFMDNFDPAYTPNHDDYMLRYSYKNQPTIIWWNLVRLGEALGELIGAGGDVDESAFIIDGVKADFEEEVVGRAEKLITQAGEEYKAVFLAQYKKLMTARIGLVHFKQGDFDNLFSEALDTMQELELDFNHFFRRLSSLKLSDIATDESRKQSASVFFHKEGTMKDDEKTARGKIAAWLEKWRARAIEDWSDDGSSEPSEAKDAERMQAMKRVNPNFVPRGWILDELIKRVEDGKEREVLDRVVHMTLNPFEEAWDGQTIDGVAWKGDAQEEQRWVGDVPKFERAMQCSCSS